MPELLVEHQPQKQHIQSRRSVIQLVFIWNGYLLTYKQNNLGRMTDNQEQRKRDLKELQDLRQYKFKSEKEKQQFSDGIKDALEQGFANNRPEKAAERILNLSVSDYSVSIIAWFREKWPYIKESSVLILLAVGIIGVICYGLGLQYQSQKLIRKIKETIKQGWDRVTQILSSMGNYLLDLFRLGSKKIDE